LERVEARKSDHLEIVLTRDVQGLSSTGLEKVTFANVALPEIDYAEIDLSMEFLGRRIAAPILISSMTGGPRASEAINKAIAEAANSIGLPFGVGSQRIALESSTLNAGLDRALRKLAPRVPILSNVGAAQLVAWDDPVSYCARAVASIEADALIVHLNPLQEAVQEGGDRNWKGVLGALERVARSVSVPLIAKEVGAGISGSVARRLWNVGVRIIDVAGTGGTSWAQVEAECAISDKQRAVASAFRDWGIPTAQAIVEVRQACPEATVIASGGIRSGIDIARSIRIGADLGAQAAGVLTHAIDAPAALVTHLETVIEQLKVTCFCTGSPNLAALRTAALQP
jgi:isopentenyl-diphosphate delta-isomerase